jgi:hypothetical protein
MRVHTFELLRFLMSSDAFCALRDFMRLPNNISFFLNPTEFPCEIL